MRIKALVLATMVLASIPTTAYAATYKTEVVNSVGIDDISISLKEYERDESGHEILYKDGKLVLPGQEVDKIVRITNEANTAWVRAKLEFTSPDGIEDMDDSMVTLSSDRWILRGDHYYYTEPLENGQSVDFINEVTIPTEWDKDYSKKHFSVIVTAEAVQTRNFDPDFESDDPWFGTVIETCVHTDYDPTFVGQEAFSVEFEGGAEGLIKVGDDFFKNWGSLLPGDTVSDKVMIRNNYSDYVKIYFRTETIADDKLLDALILTIKKGDEEIYSGPLSGGITEDVLVAYLKRGEQSDLNYSLYVPKELNNAYALTNTKTKWIFTAMLRSTDGPDEPEPTPPKETTPEPDPPKPSRPDPTPPQETVENTKPKPPGTVFTDYATDMKESLLNLLKKLPKTGDPDFALYGGIAALISLFGIVVLVLPAVNKGGKRNREKSE